MADQIYPVTKSGVQFEVRASSKEDAAAKAQATDVNSVPRIIRREGTTRVFERPNGQRYVVSPGFSSTDPDTVGRVLSGMSAGEASKTAIEQSLIGENELAARAGEFVRGTPLVGSMADELVGAIAGPEAATGMRALSGAMQRQRPGETLGLNLAGGLTAATGLAAAAPQLLGGALGAAVGQGSRGARIARGVLGAAVGQGSRGARIARGVGTGVAAGGIEGGIYGSGEGTTPASRIEEAGLGAQVGAVTGGLLFGAAPVVSEAASNVISRFRRSDIDAIASELGISKNAARVIKNTFDQGGDIQAAAANLDRAGSEAMLADAGPAAQALLDATAAAGGRAGGIARGAVDERMARTGIAVNSALDTALGAAPAGPRTAVNEISARTAPARQAAYDLAYSTPINYASTAGKKVEEVLSRVEPQDFMKAVREANAEMRSRGEVNQQIMASIDANGNITYSEMPNVRQLDELKKALQRIAYSNENTDQFGRLSGTGQRYNRLAGELRDAVSDAASPYGTAVSIGGDKLAEDRAFKLGRDLLSPRTEVEDVGFELGANPSQAQLSAAKSGLRSYIDKALGDVRAIASDPSADAMQAREVIKAVTDMSSGNAREKIRQLMGAEADALISQIDEAAQSAAVRAAMSTNSKTAARLAGKEAIDEVTAPGVVGQAMRGDAVNTTKALVQAVTGMTTEYSAAQRQRIYEDIARALTQKTGDNARVALRALDAAISGQSMTDAQTEKLARMIAGVLFVGAQPSASGAAKREYR